VAPRRGVQRVPRGRAGGAARREGLRLERRARSGRRQQARREQACAGGVARGLSGALDQRYASLTFNQYGREPPNGGINAGGLVIEVLMLPESRFPPRDGRPVVTELGLVQDLLDLAGTAAEAVALARDVRVAPAYADVHYLVCDAGGACAALELLGGRLVVSTGDGMPVRALTNSTYAASIRATRRSCPSGTHPRARGSLERFACLRSVGTALPPGADPVAWVFGHLDEVRFPDSTQWQIVYEPRTRGPLPTRSHRSVKTVALDAFLRNAPGRR
jgi:choloylglycine hydrolase